MSLTSSGEQTITTINNLNMEGVFNNTSFRQFKNLNTCEITYIKSGLNVSNPESQKNINIYDGIFQEYNRFTPTGSIQDPVDFIQNSSNTVQELTNTLNSLYKCRIYYDTTFISTSQSANGSTTIIYDNNGSILSSNFTSGTDFSLGTNADISANNLKTAINNDSNLNASVDLINKVIIVSTRSGINLSLDTSTNTTSSSSLRIENYQKVFNVLPTDMDGTAINTFKAEIIYDNNIFTDNVNTHSIQLVYDGGIVTFVRGTDFNIATPTQDETADANTTAENLRQAIDTNANFTAVIDTVNKKITVTTTSNSDLSLVNNTRTGDGFTSITNFLHQISTNNNGKIKLTQEISNEYNNNNTSFNSETQLVISDFTVLDGSGADFPHNAAIPSDTIGTYQIMNKFIESLSSIKKKITDRIKVLQEDLSNDHSDGIVDLTQDNSSTHQSNITADQSRGNLLATSTNGTNANKKPSLIEIENDTDTIKYSEDALFTFLKGIGYEVFKLQSGISGNNNNNSSGSTKAGISNIPISISTNDTGNTGTATLTNVVSTLHNISRTGNINIVQTTSEDSIPRDSIGLIDLINRIIIETTKIIREIKNNEINILNELKINNNNPGINSATFESKIEILKKRGNFLEDFTTNNTNNDKPTIYSVNNDRYSEDAIFSLFACLTFELMKLLNGKKAKNNEGNENYAGLAEIPLSIESI